MAYILQSVGLNATNNIYDTAVVQGLLKKFGYNLAQDGKTGPRTVEAIKQFQKDKVKLRNPDGKIDASGQSITLLESLLTDKYYSESENGLSLGPLIIPYLKKIAVHFYFYTEKKIVVTSGTRTSASQAAAMFEKLDVQKENISKLYKNQAAVKQIIDKYNELKNQGKNKSDIIAGMQKVIDTQIGNGIFISSHLTKKAFDLRSYDLTSASKNHLIAISRRFPVTAIDEGKPPHIHIQLN